MKYASPLLAATLPPALAVPAGAAEIADSRTDAVELDALLGYGF